jgi:pSer/pThr/pTyr-binding forkhead associated (FHA) protein
MGSNISLMNRNTVGRSRRVDIVFNDRSVDKAHSQIYQTEQGVVYVNCLGRGDVTVNGQPVNDACPVYNGDVVCFGNVVARMHLKENEHIQEEDE